MNTILNLLLFVPFCFGLGILFLRFGGKIGNVGFDNENSGSFWAADLFAAILIFFSAAPWVIQLFGGPSFADAAKNAGGTLPFLGIMAQESCSIILILPGVLFGFMALSDPKPVSKVVYALFAIALTALSLILFGSFK